MSNVPNVVGACRLQQEGSKGYFFGDCCNWARIPEYRDFVLHSPAARMAARLMDSGSAAAMPLRRSRKCTGDYATATRWRGRSSRLWAGGG